ncbi:DUF3467 domain-containing protein [Methanolobus sp. ZRKC3]|uniref:DUF3467 domain-containing protein n=1 Tax=Methanolobus sp. ZRKC3 TaxID=3125786 RepID=UPI003252F8A1
MNDKPENFKEKRKVRIEITKPEDFRQVYSIGAVGGHSPYDFRIGFYNDVPSPMEKGADTQVIHRKIETEVILSPPAAVELSRWLTQHIQDYEAKFGPIRRPQPAMVKKPETPVQDTTEIQGYM